MRFNKGKACEYFCISTLLAVDANKVVHSKVKRGLFSREEYINELEQIGSKLPERETNIDQKTILATNINQHHYDNCPEQTLDSEAEDPLKNVLEKFNMLKIVL